MAPTREAREREGNEIEFSRIVAFSDGVFAIAITLLVLNLKVPEHLGDESLGHALWAERQSYFAYAVSFAVIGRFWIIHHRFFSDVTGFDGRLLGFNLFYLAWVVLIPFSSAVLGKYGGDPAAVILYAANLAGTVVVGNVLFRDAARAGLTKTSPDNEHGFGSRSWIIAAVFGLSIPVALVSATVAQYVWLCLLLVPIVDSALRERKR
jgi:uncharacterized membrane protein